MKVQNYFDTFCIKQVFKGTTTQFNGRIQYLLIVSNLMTRVLCNWYRVKIEVYIDIFKTINPKGPGLQLNLNPVELEILFLITF